MNSIHLEKIDENNYLQAFGLKLGDGQDKFVSHPIRSLAQAYVYRDQCTPFGIFCGDTMVGYVMVIYDYDLEEYDVWHLMIDKEHQGRGYAKAAMRLCLEYIAGKPFGDSQKVVMTCAPENIPAMRLPRPRLPRDGKRRRGRDRAGPDAALRRKKQNRWRKPSVFCWKFYTKKERPN